MSTRRKLKEKIAKKEREILGLETQIREARAYIEAMREALKMLPREEFAGGTEDTPFRKGSIADRAKKALEAHGAPMHIDKLVVAMRLKADSKNKRSVAGTLASYFRRGEVFDRPEPNTFGLLGMDVDDERDDGDDSESILREVAR